MSWNLLTDDYPKLDINNILKNKSLKSFYSTHQFKQIMQKKNWTTEVIFYLQQDNISSFSFIFIKKIIGIKLIYIPGGIEGDLSPLIIKELKIFLKNLYGYSFIMFITIHDCYHLFPSLNLPFIKIINFHETRMVMKKNLPQSEDLLINSYSQNWRHNLRRSFKYKDVKINYNDKPNFNELVSLYKDMSVLKNYKSHVDRNLFDNYFSFFKDNILNVESRVNGELVAFRTVIFLNETAWDLFACSNIKSKKNYCTYQILNQIFNELVIKKVKLFDFSGVDKINNIGVYNFKKGAGGIEFKKIGEYVYSPLIFLSIVFSLILTIKRVFIK